MIHLFEELIPTRDEKEIMTATVDKVMEEAKIRYPDYFPEDDKDKKKEEIKAIETDPK
jgi:hypothetical protein